LPQRPRRLDRANNLTTLGWQVTLENSRMRFVIYLGLVGLLSGAVLFFNLRADSMGGDEALYALCVENIQSTGDFVHITPRLGEPYFQKPPLQMWLTAATAGWFDKTDFARYRIWSAIFALAAILLTTWLGSRLVAPEVGLLAGLLLLSNRKFLVDHGARSGAFDAGILFFYLCVGCFAWLILSRGARDHTSPARARGEIALWIGLGICAGLASLLKPFIGLLFIAIGVLLILLHRRDRAAWIGAAVSLVSCLVVAVPWYAARYARYGGQLFEEMFTKNVVQRATVGVDPRHLEGPAYFLRSITESSEAFWLFGPAMLLVVVASFAGDRRRECRLLAVFALGWVGAFTLSSSKMGHYVYPAFPFIAIAIAELVRAIASWLTARLGSPVARHVAATLIVGVVAATLTWRVARLVTHDIPNAQRRYVPLDLYATLRPFFTDRGMRCVIFADPSQTGMRDLFHLKLIPGAKWLHDPSELAALMQDRKPTLLIAPFPVPFELPKSAEILHAGTENRTDKVLVAMISELPLPAAK